MTSPIMTKVSIYCCPVCSCRMAPAGQASYYTKQSRFKTDMHYCNSCDVYLRDVDGADMEEHYYAASYVQLVNEERFYNQRKDFFRAVVSLAKSKSDFSTSQKPKLADFGSSYGHLLKIAEEQGFDSTGIELNKDLVQYCNDNGMSVVQRFEDLADPVDVICMIDSLYCIPAPKQVLQQARENLKEDGIVVARLTNRNLYAKLQKLLLRKDDLSILGDATVSYSMKGLRKLFKDSGFTITEFIPETAKNKNGLGMRTRFLYFVTSFLTKLTFNNWIVTPGIIVIAKRNHQKMSD